MRREEGRALARDLHTHTAALRTLVDQTAELAPQVVVAYKNRLKTRVDELLADVQLKIEQEALLREVAVFAERCDIAEELIRLRSHLDQFDELCNGDLAAVLGISESAVSHQMRELRLMKLVTAERRGRMVYYRLTDTHIQHIFQDTLRHVQEDVKE